MTDVYASGARATASRVSVSVPIWLSLMSTELATWLLMPRSMSSMLVTKIRHHQLDAPVEFVV